MPKPRIIELLKALRDDPRAIGSRTHYELLGLPPGGSDHQAVQKAFAEIVVEARNYQTGQFSKQCIAYLGLLDRAYTTLASESSREKYDRSLGLDTRPRPEATREPRPSFTFRPAIAKVGQKVGAGFDAVSVLKSLRDDPSSLDNRTHYDLLGLPPGKCDAQAVEQVYAHIVAETRPHYSGEFSKECINYLGLVSKAYTTLIDDSNRKQYDRSLGLDATQKPVPAESRDDIPVSDNASGRVVWTALRRLADAEAIATNESQIPTEKVPNGAGNGALISLIVLVGLAFPVWLFWPRFSVVRIQTTPPGATVREGSRVLGITPLEVPLRRRQVSLVAELDGYSQAKAKQYVTEETETISLSLEPTAAITSTTQDLIAAIRQDGSKAIEDWCESNEGRRLDLRNAELNNARLTYARLSGADLSRANLYGGILCGASLFEANLHDAFLRRANLSGAYLIGANLNGADMIVANLSEAYLRESDLSNADLTLANLRGAGLSKANLRNTDLNLADMHGAFLRGADLSEAKNLTQSQIDSAKGDEHTKLPAGLIRPKHWTQPKPSATSTDSGR